MAGNIIELHTEVPADLESNVFGQFDEHLKLIERTLNVTVISRDGILKILGNEQSASSAKKLIEELVVLAKRGNTITRQNINYALSLAMEQRNEVLTEIDKDFICNTIQGRPIKPKTLGQKDYVEQIRKKMIVFGVGPAGTGKTYLAMAMAVTAFRNEEVSRIILTRPAIEAGEKLGFLPGDLQRHLVGLGVIDLFLSGLDVPLTPGGDDGHVGCETLDGQFETDLVVALAGGAVGNGIRAFG